MLVLLSVLFSCTSNTKQETDEKVLTYEDSVPLSPPKASATEAKLTTVEQIQNAYGAITAAHESGKLDSTSFKYNCNGEKSGTVTYFSQNGDLKMIVHSYAEYDHNEMKDRYYIKDGSAFFAHRWSLSWSFDSGPEGATKDKITEERIYLADGKSIKCLEKKYEIRLHAGINPNPAEVANKELNCENVKPIDKSYRLLAKYWKAPAPNCLEK